jgi:hypothetical protein
LQVHFGVVVVRLAVVDVETEVVEAVVDEDAGDVVVTDAPEVVVEAFDDVDVPVEEEAASVVAMDVEEIVVVVKELEVVDKAWFEEEVGFATDWVDEVPAWEEGGNEVVDDVVDCDSMAAVGVLVMAELDVEEGVLKSVWTVVVIKNPYLVVSAEEISPCKDDAVFGRSLPTVVSGWPFNGGVVGWETTSIVSDEVGRLLGIGEYVSSIGSTASTVDAEVTALLLEGFTVVFIFFGLGEGVSDLWRAAVKFYANKNVKKT